MPKAQTIKTAATVCGALLVALLTQAEGAGEQEPACAFSIKTPSGLPAVAGPDAVLSRLHLVRHPESPVEITSADFSGTQLVIEEGSLGTNYRLQQNSVFEVRNRSDQPVDRIDVRVSVGVCQSMAPRPGSSWTGRLLPGETTRIRIGEGSGGGGTGSATGGPVVVWVWVDRVDFSGCAYRPAQVIPTSLCQERRPAFPAIPPRPREKVIAPLAPGLAMLCVAKYIAL